MQPRKSTAYHGTGATTLVGGRPPPFSLFSCQVWAPAPKRMHRAMPAQLLRIARPGRSFRGNLQIVGRRGSRPEVQGALPIMFARKRALKCRIRIMARAPTASADECVAPWVDALQRPRRRGEGCAQERVAGGSYVPPHPICRVRRRRRLPLGGDPRMGGGEVSPPVTFAGGLGGARAPISVRGMRARGDPVRVGLRARGRARRRAGPGGGSGPAPRRAFDSTKRRGKCYSVGARADRAELGQIDPGYRESASSPTPAPSEPKP